MPRREPTVPRYTAGISLREYTDLLVMHERELREAREASVALAIEVQAAAAARQLLADYVTHTAFDERLTPLERQANRWSGGQTAILVGVGLVGTITGLIIGLARL